MLYFGGLNSRVVSYVLSGTEERHDAAEEQRVQKTGHIAPSDAAAVLGEESEEVEEIAAGQWFLGELE
jgi:hypothetical protein